MTLRERFLLFVKCIIVGMASLISGLSSVALAISFQFYELTLEKLKEFLRKPKASFNILFIVIFGIYIGTVTAVRMIPYVLGRWQLQVIMLCVGLMFGGTTFIFRKTKRHISFINILLLTVFFFGTLYLKYYVSPLEIVSNTNVLLFLGAGILSGILILLPGLNITFALTLFGSLDIITKAIKDLINLKDFLNNLVIVLPFWIGFSSTLIWFAKLLILIKKKYEDRFYYIILGLVMASITIMLLEINPFKYSVVKILTSIFTFFWGYLLARRMEYE